MVKRTLIIAMAMAFAGSAAADKALYVAVVMDVDRSVRKLSVPDAAKTLLQGLGANGEDLGGVFAVADSAVSIMAMSSMGSGPDKTAALEALTSTRSRRYTRDLAASLDGAAQYLTAFPGDAVRVIVLIHGGPDEGDAGSLATTLQGLAQQKIAVHAVAVGGRVDTATLSRIARGTGGVLYEATSANALDVQMGSVLGNLATARSGRAPTAATPTTPTPTTPTGVKTPTAAKRSQLMCRNAAGSTISVVKGGTKASVIVTRKPPAPPQKGQTTRVKPPEVFTDPTSPDLRQQQHVVRFSASVPTGACRFSDSHPEVVACNHQQPVMYEVQGKTGARTLLAGWLQFTTNRVAKTTLDGRSLWVEARLVLGLNDPSRPNSAKVGGQSLTVFKLSECQ